MTIKKQIRLRPRFQRSTRLDADAGAVNALDGYMLHQTGWQVLSRLCTHLDTTSDRAFTWTGPYGAGKSSLALLLARLLDGNPAIRRSAHRLLGPERVARLHRSFPTGRKGWLVIRVVAQRQDPESMISAALDSASIRRWGNTGPAVSETGDESPAHHLVARLLAAADKAAKEGAGLLLIVDEMGKLLEHAADQRGDLYIFQDIAESFSRTDAPCVFVGILHQSFLEYATVLDRAGRDEWAKIQGRFVDVPFSVALEEVVELIGTAIDAPPPPRQYKDLIGRVAQALAELRSGPTIQSALSRCWPLHPLTALLLGPISRERFGQNERSTFGFLCSGEPGGFRECIETGRVSTNSPYTPDLLWNYLRFNLEPAILASPSSHRWVEAADAVERAARKGHQLHVSLMKTVALVDLFGRPYALRATPKLLSAAFHNAAEGNVQNCLKELSDWSVLVYRRHAGSWAVFAGSDVDLDAEVRAAKAQLGKDTSVLVAAARVQPPIVAKRHYHTTGTLRWFSTRLAIASDLVKETERWSPDSTETGAFYLVLHAPDLKERQIREQCLSLSRHAAADGRPTALGYSRHSSKLFGLAHEITALEKVRFNLPSLEGDAIGRRELAGRLDAARSTLSDTLRAAFLSAEWYINGQLARIDGPQDLSRLASDLCDQIYAKTPIIRNELINRERPSSNAVAARRALMHHMVDSLSEENLGIEGYPAELGIYLSILRAAGLHRADPTTRRTWAFTPPKDGIVSHTFSALWTDADDFLTSTEQSPKPIAELYRRWPMPPFGLRHGVMPILALAVLLAKEQEVALYVDGAFTPAIDDFVVDRLLQSPEGVSVRRFPVDGVRQDALAALTEFVAGPSSVLKGQTALGVAKPLVSFAHKLRPWVKRTSTLTAETRKIRDLLLRANDPYVLLFVDLPAVCNVELPHDEDRNEAAVNTLSISLRRALAELRCAYDGMLQDMQLALFEALGAPEGNGAVNLKQRAELVVCKSGDLRLDAFARRLGAGHQDTQWIEGLASLAASKPPRDWTDNDLERARLELVELARKFRRVERYVLAKSTTPNSLALAALVGDEGSETEIHQAFLLDDIAQKRVERAVDSMQRCLTDLSLGSELQVAAVTRLLARLSKPFDAPPATKQYRSAAKQKALS